MARATVICIVEGQTENAVLKKLVAPHLGSRGIDFHVPIVTIGHGRGGVRFLKADELYDQIRRFLKDRRQPYVTTLFDYYGLPTSEGKGWGFISKFKSEASFRGPDKVAELIETEIQRNSLQNVEVPNVESRVLPYIQVHELEALFFAEPVKLADAFGNPGFARKFAQIVDECGGCEKINDTPLTAPSKRIENVFSGYIKGRSTFAHGPRIAEKLDLGTVRAQCPRFNAWLGKLENLGSTEANV
jgi:hypothetical protein